MRWNASWLVGVLGICVLAGGCGPNVSQSDLGTVVYDIPEVPGAEEPYELPIDPPSPENQGASARTKAMMKAPPPAEAPK